MQTLLEFACEKLMGPPTRRAGNGDSGWPCPNCAGDSFHTLPHHSAKPHQRFYCHHCGFGGDVWDLMKLRFPHESYYARKYRVDGFVRDGGFDPAQKATHAAKGTGSAFPPWMRSSTAKPARNEQQVIAELYPQLTNEEAYAIALTFEIATAKKVDITMLACHVHKRRYEEAEVLLPLFREAFQG